MLDMAGRATSIVGNVSHGVGSMGQRVAKNPDTAAIVNSSDNAKTVGIGYPNIDCYRSRGYISVPAGRRCQR